VSRVVGLLEAIDIVQFIDFGASERFVLCFQGQSRRSGFGEGEVGEILDLRCVYGYQVRLSGAAVDDLGLLLNSVLWQIAHHREAIDNGSDRALQHLNLIGEHGAPFGQVIDHGGGVLIETQVARAPAVGVLALIRGLGIHLHGGHLLPQRIDGLHLQLLDLALVLELGLGQ